MHHNNPHNCQTIMKDFINYENYENFRMKNTDKISKSRIYNNVECRKNLE